MEKTVQRGLVAGAALAGAALIGGAFYVLQERKTGEPDFRALKSDGDFQIRDYPAMTVAETVVQGPRKAALGEGFQIIADYIFAKSRTGEKIAMTVPVMQDSGDPMASDPPLFDDELEGAWRTRFVMPSGRSADDLPDPPDAPTTGCWPKPKTVCVAGWRKMARRPMPSPNMRFTIRR